MKHKQMHKMSHLKDLIGFQKIYVKNFLHFYPDIILILSLSLRGTILLSRKVLRIISFYNLVLPNCTLQTAPMQTRRNITSPNAQRQKRNMRVVFSRNS